MAVKYRCETLPGYINASHISRESACDIRTVRKCLTFMSTLMPALVTENEDKTITVHGAREIHESSNYPWKDGLHDINVCKDVGNNAYKDVGNNALKK